MLSRIRNSLGDRLLLLLLSLINFCALALPQEADADLDEVVDSIEVESLSDVKVMLALSLLSARFS